MSHTKQASKRKRSRTAVPILGAAGLSLSLAGTAAATTAVPADVPTTNAAGHEFTLAEEEITDVSLATFYVVDKENAAPVRLGGRLAMGACGACGCGCGCGAGCWTGTNYTSSVLGNPNPPPPPVKPAHKQAHVRKGTPTKNP